MGMMIAYSRGVEREKRRTIREFGKSRIFLGMKISDRVSFDLSELFLCYKVIAMATVPIKVLIYFEK